MRTRFARGLVGVGFLLPCFASLFAADPAPAKKEADPVAEQVRKAAKTAEVHGIGVHSPLHHRLDKIATFPDLIAKLRTKEKKAPVERVWQMLSKETQDKVLDDKYFGELGMPGSSLALLLEAAVASDLRKIIDNPDFYTEEAFKDFLLTKELKDLIALGKKRTFLQTAKLNWALLERVFPDHIPEMPERFRTVRVQIVGGKDVVLVLSCYSKCRWEVALRGGAKVTGVILCGYHAQEVVGVKVPVVYRCAYELDGVTPTRGVPHFFGHDEKRDKGFLASVKQITDKDFTTFQGKYQPKPGDEPFTIFPIAQK